MSAATLREAALRLARDRALAVEILDMPRTGWGRGIYEKIVERVTQGRPLLVTEHPDLPGAQVGRYAPAVCPLCERGPFAVPIGLRRHLWGEGKAEQCPVMTAIFAADDARPGR